MKNAPNANALKNKGKNKMPSKEQPELQSLSKYASHNVKRSFGSVAEFEMVQYMAIIEDNMYENSLIREYFNDKYQALGLDFQHFRSLFCCRGHSI